MPEQNEVLAPTPPRRGRTGCWIGAAVAGAALFGLLAVGAGRVRAGAKSTYCRNCLSSLGIAMHLYADDNGGAFPERLDLLYTENYTDNPKIFSCASNPSSYNDFKTPGQVTDKSTSFVYLAGRSNWSPGPFHLMHDKPGNHGGGFNALRVDACTEWWPTSRAAEFQRRVELENEAIARWRATGQPAETFAEFIGPELQDLLKRPVPKLRHGKAIW